MSFTHLFALIYLVWGIAMFYRIGRLVHGGATEEEIAASEMGSVIAWMIGGPFLAIAVLL